MANLNKQLGTLSTRITGYVIAVIFVLSIINGTISLRKYYKKVFETASLTASVSLEAAVSSIEDKLDMIETATNSIAGLSDLITHDPNSAYSMLEKLLNSCQYVTAASLLFSENYYPEKGREYSPSIIRDYLEEETRTDVSSIGFSYLDTGVDDNWEAGKEGKTVWSYPYMQTHPPYSVRVAYSAPVYDADEKLAAVLCSTIETEWIRDEIEKIIYSPETETFVIHKKGLFVCHTDSTRTLTNAFDSFSDDDMKKVLDEMVAGKTGSMKIGRRDARYVFYAPIEGGEFYVGISCPENLIIAPAKAVIKEMAIPNLLALALAFMVLLAGIFLIVKPFSLRLKKYTEESASLERDLSIASKLQQDMLPGYSGQEFDGIRIGCTLKPEKMIGGDFYDFFCRDGKFFFCIGDVSGNGVSAGFFMSSILTMFRDICQYETDPEAIVARINAREAEDNPECMFCTMFVAVLDIASGHMDYCNAGHNAPLVFDGTSEMCFLPDAVSVPIGVFEDTGFAKESLTLSRGARIFLYTDGVTEARDKDAGMFGPQRTLEFVSARPDMDPDGLVKAFLAELERFSDGVEQSDDITMLYVKYA